jgi:hypothetical protein
MDAMKTEARRLVRLVLLQPFAPIISDEPSTIVGVMPKNFHFPINMPAYFWATFAADSEGVVPNTSQRGWDALVVIGRMKLGVRPEHALADLNTIQARLALLYRYPDPGKVPYFEKLLPQLAAIPGVEKVSGAHPLPLFSPTDSSTSFTISAHPTLLITRPLPLMRLLCLVISRLCPFLFFADALSPRATMIPNRHRWRSSIRVSPGAISPTRTQ